MAVTAAKRTVAVPAKAQRKTKTIAASAVPPAAKTKKIEETTAVVDAPVIDVAIIKEGLETMTETVKTTAAEAAEKATGMFKQFQARAEKAFGSPTELGKDVLEFHKGNFEALVEAGKLAAAGTKTAFQNAGDVARKNWDAQTAHVKALAGVKSPTEFLKLQGEFVRGQFDNAVAEMSKSTEAYVKFAGEVAAPLQNRYAKVAEDVKARFAA